jgi:Zn-dependent protease
MKHALCIARIRGIPLRVHWSFVALLLLLVVSYQTSGLRSVLEALLWFVAVFASVTIHELSHCLIARQRGLTVRDIVLLPIGGVSEILRIRRGSRNELDVSLAGPAASLALAAVLVAIAEIGGLRLWPPSLVTGSLVVRIMWANVLLAAFNMLPALPFDGGHVLRALLSRRLTESKATKVAARAGVVFGCAMVGVGALVDLWVSVIGVFVLISASSERQIAAVRERIGDRHVRDLFVANAATLDANLAGVEARAFLESRPQQSTPVTRDGVYLGMISLSDLEGQLSGTSVEQWVDRSAPLLSPDDDLYPDAMMAFAECGRHELAVGESNRVAGVLYEMDAVALVRRNRGGEATPEDPQLRTARRRRGGSAG